MIVVIITTIERLASALTRRPPFESTVRRRLLDAIAALAPASAPPSTVPTLFRAMIAAIASSSSSSWHVILSAAMALGIWSGAHESALYLGAVVPALDSHRFHRIVQVRTAVVDALERWSSIDDHCIIEGRPNRPRPSSPSPPPTPPEMIPIPFEIAPPRSTSSGNSKIARQQRQLLDMVDDICRRFDGAMIRVDERLLALETATSEIREQNAAAINDDIDVWGRIVDRLDAGDVNDAFHVALQSPNDVPLIHLLARSDPNGPTSSSLWSLLLGRFATMILGGRFLDDIAPWIMKATDRDDILIPIMIDEALAEVKAEKAMAIATISEQLAIYRRRRQPPKAPSASD